jgi:ABC-type Mn2+/Zn2+ transport system permease subunit
MLEMLSIPFMRQALLASLLLGIMLSYLGIHVVKRRIVFVDLAIAQLSAVGVAMAMLLDRDPVTFSMGFTLTGAALLSLPAYERRIPQEAVMGIVYAVASAVAILMIAKMPHGEADILNLFYGNILAVTTKQIEQLLLIFGLVVAIHTVFQKQLMHIPGPSAENRDVHRAEFGWNLLFYLTLALVIAVAIRTAGVLVVFSNLVIPAVAAFLFAERFRTLIFLSVGIGLIANWTGLYASYHFDLPTGPSIVTSLGSWLVLVGLYKGLLGLLKGKK